VWYAKNRASFGVHGEGMTRRKRILGVLRRVTKAAES
jgi:hypothetical protein